VPGKIGRKKTAFVLPIRVVPNCFFYGHKYKIPFGPKQSKNGLVSVFWVCEQ
jgi:hypothetical protein